MNLDNKIPEKDIYLRSILEQGSRILGEFCRTPSMKTLGCFDRSYWNYSIYDVPGARFQEGVLTLALLYQIEHSDNPYYKYPRFLEWIRDGMLFWASIQLPSGAFNDLYPNEHSFVATAFSLYAITETILLLKDEIEVPDVVYRAIFRSAEWLISQKQPEVLNQDCGAVAAIFNVFLLSEDKKFQTVTEGKVEQLARKQTSEGWFNEYGGPDIGYLSVAIDYLAKYWKKSKSAQAEGIILKALEFLSHFCHPDYTFGGEYGSRGTAYLLPHGFELFAHRNKTSVRVAAYIRMSLFRKSAVLPLALDDKYLIFYSYSCLQAYLDGCEQLDVLREPVPTEQNYKYFTEAGLIICNNETFHLICNLRKGGALRLLFKKTGRVLSDSGILLKGKNGNMLTSCWIDSNSKIIASPPSFTKEGSLSIPFDNRLTVIKNILLRIIQMTIGRSEKGSRWLKEQLRKRIISHQRLSTGRFRRIITMYPDRVEVLDEVFNMKGLFKVIVGDSMDSIYGESARYAVDRGNAVKPICLNNVRMDGSKFRLIRNYNNSGSCQVTF